MAGRKDKPVAKKKVPKKEERTVRNARTGAGVGIQTTVTKGPGKTVVTQYYSVSEKTRSRMKR